MNNENNLKRKLVVSFSNGVECYGLIDLDFAISHVAELFPDASINVLIQKIENNNNCVCLYERINGEWIEHNNPKQPI